MLNYLIVNKIFGMFRVLFTLTVAFYVVDATIIVKPPPVPDQCNIYEKNLCWVLDNCVCRPIQNPCLRDAESKLRIKNRKKRKYSTIFKLLLT